MHQPDYRDPKTGVAELPWVRLHAASAYRDMALALREQPHVKATVNFVPSLVAQIEANAPDAYEMLARRPAGALDAAERDIVIGRFFSVHWGRQVETRPRYRELLEKKRATTISCSAASRSPARRRASISYASGALASICATNDGTKFTVALMCGCSRRASAMSRYALAAWSLTQGSSATPVLGSR